MKFNMFLGWPENINYIDLDILYQNYYEDTVLGWHVVNLIPEMNNLKAMVTS